MPPTGITATIHNSVTLEKWTSDNVTLSVEITLEYDPKVKMLGYESSNISKLSCHKALKV
jgi:hypothetical protein